jgi:hypothetical protein
VLRERLGRDVSGMVVGPASQLTDESAHRALWRHYRRLMLA